MAAVLSFMVARGDTPGPLFSEEDGKYLTRVKFVTEVRSGLRRAGYPAGAQLQNRGCHSSREMRDPRFLNKNARSLGKFSLHKLYQNAVRDIIRSVKKTTGLRKEQEPTNKYRARYRKYVCVLTS